MSVKSLECAIAEAKARQIELAEQVRKSAEALAKARSEASPEARRIAESWLRSR